MFMTSFGRFGLNSSGAVPAADIALEAINANPNILAGYNLVYDRVRDSEVSLSRASLILKRPNESDEPMSPISYLALKPELEY